jgi:hypothetical protein
MTVQKVTLLIRGLGADTKKFFSIFFHFSAKIGFGAKNQFSIKKFFSVKIK